MKNPFSESILIESDQAINRVYLINIQGMYVMESSERKIDTSRLTSGIYQMVVISETGELYTEKLIKP